MAHRSFPPTDGMYLLYAQFGYTAPFQIDFGCLPSWHHAVDDDPPGGAV